MTYNSINKNENKGFSLIELIVVVAIMAVLVAILGPSLLSYVERSRARKDDSTMSELTNAILLALSDHNVYDEVLCYSAYNNVSCYIDKSTEPESGKIETKAEVDLGGKGKSGPQYIYDDEHRLADEIQYYAAGNMRGVTITFMPEPGNTTRKSIYSVKNGIINKFTGANGTARDVALTYINSTPAAETMTLGKMKSVDSNGRILYNRVRATIGDEIKLTSQTYRNSEYTVFIRMGTTGGNQINNQDAIKVYGQWGGTNLAASSES